MTPWKVAVLSYILIGVLVILGTKARREVFDALSPAERSQIPVWKSTVFYCITIPTALLFWPVFLPSWLRKKETLWDQFQRAPGSGQLNAIFEAMNELSATGCLTDEIPGAHGKFGYEVSNPVPTHTTFGSVSYLGRLRTLTGQRIVYERIGSFASPVSEFPVDGYELTDETGRKLGIIYLSPYHQRNSEKVPSGLVQEH